MKFQYSPYGYPVTVSHAMTSNIVVSGHSLEHSDYRDMLRYDQAFIHFPTLTQALNEVDADHENYMKRYAIPVLQIHGHNLHPELTVGRWNSFGINVSNTHVRVLVESLDLNEWITMRHPWKQNNGTDYGKYEVATLQSHMVEGKRK